MVWRELLVADELRGVRRHPGLASIAETLGMPTSSVHKALQRPLRMGIVRARPGGGLRLLDPMRLLLLWAGRRTLAADLLDERRVCITAVDAERALPEQVILGGFGAVVARCMGNRISDYDRVLCYGGPSALAGLPESTASTGTIVSLYRADPRLQTFGAVTPLCQAFVDLFNTPGWPAARFVGSLIPELLRAA